MNESFTGELAKPVSKSQVPLNEIAEFQDKKLQREMKKLNRKPIEALEKQIAEATVAP